MKSILIGGEEVLRRADDWPRLSGVGMREDGEHRVDCNSNPPLATSDLAEIGSLNNLTISNFSLSSGVGPLNACSCSDRFRQPRSKQSLMMSISIALCVHV